MNKEETQKVLEELYEVRPELLNDKAKRLYEAIMQIADERDKAYKIIEKQEKIINDIKFITYNNKPHITQEKIIEYFKKEVEKECES